MANIDFEEAIKALEEEIQEEIERMLKSAKDSSIEKKYAAGIYFGKHRDFIEAINTVGRKLASRNNAEYTPFKDTDSFDVFWDNYPEIETDPVKRNEALLRGD